MKRIKVDTFWEYEECECGGIFSHEINNMEYLHLTYPMCRYFKCSVCGRIELLPEEKWPKVVHEVNNG